MCLAAAVSFYTIVRVVIKLDVLWEFLLLVNLLVY